MTSSLNITLRKVRCADLAELVALFKETVHTVNATDYTPEQLAVWAPSHVHHRDARWQTMLDNIAFVAEVEGAIAGFIDMTIDGYLDRLFVHKAYQRQGIASALIKHLEQTAIQQGITHFTTEASITAKPFFERAGYHVVKAQEKEVNGVCLRNYLMEKYVGN